MRTFMMLFIAVLFVTCVGHAAYLYEIGQKLGGLMYFAGALSLVYLENMYSFKWKF